MDDDIPYLLLTPGPLTTSRSVKQAMLQDYCTWDRDYNDLVSDIRRRLVKLATSTDEYTSVLMQGSGTFSVEATLGSVVPPAGKLLVCRNGAYGDRMAAIAERLNIQYRSIEQPETEPTDVSRVAEVIQSDASITHVAMVHCETTTGLLNPAREVGQQCRRFGKVFLLDAMSSFGGMEMSVDGFGVDFLISSANKCIQGVPGFGFVIARWSELERTKGWARSLSLDLYEQWQEMELNRGKWRYTSPTHAVRAFARALDELEEEGGVAARYRRYCENHRKLVTGLRQLGFQTLLPDPIQSPFITSFLYPNQARFSFTELYDALKKRRFVIYPGKVSQAATFRVGTIGHVFPDDIRHLVEALADALDELGMSIASPTA